MAGLESDSPKKNPLTAEHTIYKIGRERVPSVTGIIGTNLGWKWPALMGWQRKMFRQGIDPDAAASEAGTVGTLVHMLIHSALTGEPVPDRFFSKEQREIADRALIGFWEWWKENKIEPIYVERPLTHTRLRYGGTIDLWCKKGKKYLLADWKSSSAVFVDHRIQLAAYSELINHRIGKPHDRIIFHLDKNTGQFTPHPFVDLKSEMEVFLLCLKLQKIRSRIS